MQAFRDVLDECGFQDLGFQGPEFTWCNNRINGATVWARLDRMVANSEWLLKFQAAWVHHIQGTLSDHLPLWLSPIPVHMIPRKRMFRFESMWLMDEGCRRTVEAAWKANSDGPDMKHLWNRVTQCQRQLGSWSCQCFGSVRRQLADKRSQLQDAELISMQGGDHHQVLLLRKELSQLLSKEEVMWSQRARSSWLREGDRNTRFFHSRASQRRRRNAILGLRDENGEWCEQTDQVSWIAVEYFQNLFQTAGPTEIHQVTNNVPRVVTVDMHTSLSQDILQRRLRLLSNKWRP